jgi:CDP-diacylglycerol--glycerol-3-phosphate 3-phosphatidyltransferase
MSVVSPSLRDRVRGIATPVALAMGRVGLTPNALTLIGFGGTVVAAIAAGLQAWILAGILVLVFGIFDLFDGTLARATGRASRLGAFLDSVFDRWGEGIVYVGIVAGCLAADFKEGAVLGAAAMASAFMVSYARAKSEGLGFTAGTGMAAVGLAPREVRLLILTVGLVWAGLAGGVVTTDCGNLFCIDGMLMAGDQPLFLSLALITILATITVIQRIIHVVNQNRQQENT